MQGVADASRLLGMDVYDFIEPDDRERAAENARKVLLGKPVEGVEYRMRRRDGSVFDGELSAALLPGPDGRPVGFVAAVRDITERKLAERALRESEERFKSIFEFAADGLLLADIENKRFMLGNRKICDMLGYTLDELRQLKVSDIHPKESIPKVINAFERQARRNLTLAPDLPVLRKDGTVFYADINSFPVFIEGRKYLLGNFRDITERKRLEKEVLEIGDQVQYHIGHELHDGVNQLLTSASLRIEALRQKTNEGRLLEESELADLAGLIRQTMDQVSSMARGLSPLSIKSGGLAMGLAELCRSTTFLGIKCLASIDESVEVPNLAEATHLYRIAQEAINNAVKHSGSDKIEVTLGRRQGYGLLAVSDDGRGMPGDISKRGGMGLNIMRYRAGMIGADLEIVAGRDRGTEVRCRFCLRTAKERERGR
jgi:PAS domain S-box-containing protein